MKKVAAVVLTSLFFTFAAWAQDIENQPVLFDEFGELSNDDTGGRVQNLWVESEKTKNSRALVRIYGGREKSFAAPYIRGSLVKILWRIYNLPPEKLLIQFCNVNQEPLLTRTFIIRENDRIETCEENLSISKETTLFEEIYFSYPEFKLTPYESSGGVDANPQGEYSAYAQAVLRRMLRESPASKVYIIGYLQADQKKNDAGEVISKQIVRLDKSSLSKQMLQTIRAELIKNGVSASQIVTLNGGYVFGDNRRVELWFVPAGGAIPKPSPDYVPKKRK